MDPIELSDALDDLGVGRRVAIAGNTTVGSVLTATLRPGWLAESYQWTRDGVAIAGATASTYTLQAADNGTVIGCQALNLYVEALGLTIPSQTVEASYLTDESGQRFIDENNDHLTE